MAYTILNFPGNLEKSVTLSYDDGVEQDIRLVSILNKYGLKSTFNINTGLFTEEGHIFKEGQIHRRMTEKTTVELFGNQPHEVAVHGLTHPWLDKLPSSAVVYEIEKDKENIEKLFGTIARGMAYPFGAYNDEVVDVISKVGIVYSRTVSKNYSFDLPKEWLRWHPTIHHTDARLPELTDKFLTEKKQGTEPWLFYLWGHSYEFEEFNNWNVIETFAEKVGHHDDIWYATNIEVYEYVEAYRALVYSADGKTVYNPSAVKVYFSVDGKKFSIASGETIRI